MNPVSNTEYGCNCRSKESCQLQNKCLTPKIAYQADVKNLTKDEKCFTLELQKYPLKKVLVTTHKTSNTPNTEIALSYQNIYGNSKMLIYHQLLSRVLLQKCSEKHNLIFANYVSEKFYIIKSLNDPHLLNKKSELVKHLLLSK